MGRIAGHFDHVLPELNLELARPPGIDMHILFDLTNGRALARHESHIALAALAVIQFANVDTTLIRVSRENKAYTCLPRELVGKCIIAAGGVVPVGSYGDEIRAMRELIEDAPWLLLPFEESELVAQASSLEPNESEPYAFAPGLAVPQRLKQWHCEPQRNMKRSDSTYWIHFASGGAGQALTSAATPPHLTTATGKRVPSARPRPAPAPGGTPTPRTPRAPAGGPATRPKAGSSTGRVWDHADAAFAKSLEGRELRAAVIKACEADGINLSTASVQFGKWKNARA